MTRREKIDITEVWKVARYGSGWYLRIPTDLVLMLGLKRGDRLRVKIEEVMRVEASL